MHPRSFVLETLSHFVCDIDGPPPGIPLGADAGFETALATLCVEQAISPIVSRSLDSLVLPPNLSALTAERLRRHARSLGAAADRRLRLAARAVAALENAGVRCALMGDARAYADYPAGARAVGVVELLIHPRETARAIGVLTALGVRLPGPHAVFGRVIPRTTVSTRRMEELVRYHYYFAPLVLTDGKDLVVRLRHRICDAGDPHTRGDALERSVARAVGGDTVSCVSDEDHLVDLAVRAGIDALAVLPTVVDIARLLVRRGETLNWERVEARARLARVYAPVRYVIRHACALMGVADYAQCLAPAGLLWEPYLDAWWSPGRIDYADLPARRSGRFAYGLMCVGRLRTRTRWTWGHVAFHRRWVRNRMGGRPTLWRCVRFLFAARETPEWWRALGPAGEVAGPAIPLFRKPRRGDER